MDFVRKLKQDGHHHVWDHHKDHKTEKIDDRKKRKKKKECSKEGEESNRLIPNERIDACASPRMKKSCCPPPPDEITEMVSTCCSNEAEGGGATNVVDKRRNATYEENPGQVHDELVDYVIDKHIREFTI